MGVCVCVCVCVCKTIWSITSSFFFFFGETKTPSTPRPGMDIADHMLKVGRPAGSRRLMIKSSEPSPNYLTMNQSEKSPSTLIPNVVLNRHFLKAIREFSSFEHELPFPLLGSLQINAVLSFTTWCQETGFAGQQASRPQFASVTFPFWFL